MEHVFLLCVDIRFPGGTSSAVVNEIKALANRFDPQQVGILCIESGLFSGNAPTNAALVDALLSCPFPVYRFDAGRGAFSISPLTATQNRRGVLRLHAKYLIVHNPHVAVSIASLEGRLSADMALVVCHQPYVDKAGIPYYSAADIIAGVRQIAQAMRFVPIGSVARSGFLSREWTAGLLTDFDWPNVFDFNSEIRHFRRSPLGHLQPDTEVLTIGRHSRPEWVKWPGSKEEFSQIYQHGARRSVRFLGWGAYCEGLFKDDMPPNWDALQFNAVNPEVFLQSIDVFVYYHHPNWVEGFGRTIPEAMASRVPCVLTPSLAPTFRGLALYSRPELVGPLLTRLDGLRGELKQWSERVREVAKVAFGLERITEIYAGLSDAILSGDVNFQKFTEVEREIAAQQNQLKQTLEAEFAFQEQLGLATDDAELSHEVHVNKIVEAAQVGTIASQIQTADFAIYMDLRSARSDVWRTVELAQSLSQSGYEVCLVHVQTTSKVDHAELNPMLDELGAEIPIHGYAGDSVPRYLEVRIGLIIAAPQLMFGENGRPLFESSAIPRPMTPAAVILLDKKQPASWYQGADDSLALMCGVRAKWATIGLSAEEVPAVLRAIEVPALRAFVAHRSTIIDRDLLKHISGRQSLRRGRIGLMDSTQWQVEEGKAVENFGETPIFAYAPAHARSAPEDLRNNPHFYDFRAADISLKRFLEKIDLVTYFPSKKPSDLMLFPVLRAVQAGVLAVVDGGLKEHFGELAMYSASGELGATIQRLCANPDHVTRTGLTKARDLVLKGLQKKAVQAIESLVSNGRAAARAPESVRATNHVVRSLDAKPEVLFVSSNGVGLGHLTRLMAIARRLQRCDPVFLTMSQAFRIVEAAGWPVKFLPFHEVAGCNIEHWNEWLKFEVEQILSRRSGIRSLVFDGSNPYSGLLSAFASTQMRKIWIQRGMWKEGHMNAEHVRRGKNFDLIIEPSDIAESSAAAQVESPAFDKVKTNPIWLLDSDELLSRSEARTALGIPEDHQCCLIQLGSGANRDIASLLSTIIPALKQQRIAPYIAEWLMGSEVPRAWPGVVYMRLFPLSKYIRAFDFSISAAGYNSYHELLGFGVPTIFIANEHQMMDDQAARAQYAMRNDAAIWIAEDAVDQIESAIDLITQKEVCELMMAGCAALTRKNGALEAAQIVDTLTTDVGLGTLDDARSLGVPMILAA